MSRPLKKRKVSVESFPLRTGQVITGNSVANLRAFAHNEDIANASANMHNKDISKVLVICTGGTLTMVHTDRGYVAEKGFVNRLKVYSNLHDKDYAK